MLIPAITHAALNCTPTPPSSPHHNSSINVYDTDDNLPLEPVGRWLRHSLTFQCTATAPWNGQYAVTFVPTAQTAAIGATGQTAAPAGGFPLPVFTTPQLSSLGLGYILYWHTTQESPPLVAPARGLTGTNQILVGSMIQKTDTHFLAHAQVWVHYVKIAPLASYETAHALNPSPVPLASFFVTDSPSPAMPLAGGILNLSIPVPALTLTRRTCTTPSPTYNLGYANFISDFPAIGSTGPELEFTLTFNCPQGYNFVGISFVPVNGAADEALHPGVMNSNLPGVGVQLLTRMVKADNPGNTGLSPDWQPVQFGHPYWLRQYLRPGTGNPDLRRDYSETFRARYYRTGNNVSGGQMKAAVWIHMVYK